jgi:hypothetical protein
LASIQRGDYYDRQESPVSKPKVLTVPADQDNTYRAGAVAFRSFGMLLDRPMHFIGLRLHLEKTLYNPYDGTFSFQPEFFFEQWREGMKEDGYSPQHARWAGPRKGAFEFSVDIWLLQFAEGCIQQQTDQNHLIWKGGNKIPNEKRPGTFIEASSLYRDCPDE